MTDQKMIIASNLKRLISENGISQKELSEKIGISPSTMSDYMNLRAKPSHAVLQKIADYFGVGKSDIDTTYKDIEFINTVNKLPSKTYKLFNNSVAAGLPSTIDAVFENDLEDIELPDMMMNGYAGNSDILIMKVNGDSMNNVIPHDSLIGVKKWEVDNLKKNDIVVFSDNGEFSMKRYLNDEQNKRIIFRPDSSNDNFSDIVISYENADNLNIIGKVIVSIINYD